MNEERGFIEAITSEPTDYVAQLVYADWLAERSRPEEIAWRWIAAFRRRPCSFRAWRIDSDPYWAAAPCSPLRADESPGGYGWVNWQWNFEYERPQWAWPWSAGMSTLPRPLFRWLPSGNMFDDGYMGHRPFNDVAEAFDALVKAFLKATAPRNWLQRRLYGPTWEPDWSLVLSVPDE